MWLTDLCSDEVLETAHRSGRELTVFFLVV